jgi:hypothetical protein
MFVNRSTVSLKATTKPKKKKDIFKVVSYLTNVLWRNGLTVLASIPYVMPVPE